MRVVVLGATGNVGTSLVEQLADDPAIRSILGVSRRPPHLQLPKTEWSEADIERSPLVPLLRGADALVHLAWRIQPSRDLNALWRTNVAGSARVLAAVAEAGVKVLVYASSVGVYSAGPKDCPVDESWPREGIPTSFYGLHKAEVERRLDRLELERPDLRVVRMRTALVFKREAASGIRRLFLGPFVPRPLLRARFVPLVPSAPGLAFQAVHADDAARAYRLALVRDVYGPFNVAAEPVLDPPLLAELANARVISVPAAFLRGAAAVTWRLRLQPSPPGWVDLGLGVPLMDTRRAREELGWAPARRADDALRELLAGMRERAGAPTPPLDPSSAGPLRIRELASGIGGRQGS